MKNARFLDRTTPPHIITLVVIAGVAALCMNLFLPSLAAMALHFETDYAVMQFAVSGYLAATACLQLLIGPLSDLFGRRPVMLASIAMMIVATLVCMLAPDITVFMFGRVAQAAVVSGFVLARAIVRDMVPMEQAASMIGYVTMGMSVVPMVGPTVGGLLNDISGWQSSFALLALLGVGILVLAWFDLGETNHNRSASFAAVPRLAGTSALATLLGICADLDLLVGHVLFVSRRRPFVGSVLYGLAPAMLGLQFFFMASGYMLGNFVSGRYASQIGITRMMLSGNVVAIAGIVAAIALISTGAESPYAFFVPLALIGVGNGVTLPSANAGMVSVQPHLAGSASGLGGAMTIGGGAALSVLASSVLSKEDGTWPLLLVMLATGLVALLTTYIVRLQEKRQ